MYDVNVSNDKDQSELDKNYKSEFQFITWCTISAHCSVQENAVTLH